MRTTRRRTWIVIVLALAAIAGTAIEYLPQSRHLGFARGPLRRLAFAGPPPVLCY